MTAFDVDAGLYPCATCAGAGSWRVPVGTPPTSKCSIYTSEVIGTGWLRWFRRRPVRRSTACCTDCRGTGFTTHGLRIGAAGRTVAPGFSCCGRCSTPWAFVEPRHVDYRPDRGMFALCVSCWDETTEMERRMAHRSWWARWGDDDQELWNEIDAAVRAAA